MCVLNLPIRLASSAPPPEPIQPMPRVIFRLLPCLLGLTLAGTLVSADSTPPTSLASLTPISARIPDRAFSAAKLGVTPGASAPVTAKLQAAIDHVSAQGGGRLVVEPGDYWIGPTTLASHLELHLSAGVVLHVQNREQGYPAGEKRYESVFTARGATDIRVSGPGMIQGHGETWWRAFHAKEIASRPQIFTFSDCQRVELHDFTIANPPNSHVSLSMCEEVRIRGLTLEAPDESPNTDGINLSGRNYLITGCKISTGDDNLVVRTHTGRKAPYPMCENIVVRDCAFGFGHGLTIGSYTLGGIRNFLAERITFDRTSCGIRMKASRERGGLVENLTYRDLDMRAVKHPVYISSYYPKEPKQPGLESPVAVTATTPRWRNIRIENVRCAGSDNSIALWGLPEMPLGEIILRNASFASKRGAKLVHAPDLVLENVSVVPASGPAFERWPKGVSDP